MVNVPWSNAGVQYKTQKSEIDAAIQRVLVDGRHTLNDDVLAFEKEFASYCDVDWGVSVGSGSDAIILSLLALGVGQGHEVVSVANSCWSIPNAILHSGAKPVLVDIDADTYNIDPDRIVDAMTPRTRAILAVHSYGQPCDIARIREIADAYHVPIIEDITVAPGARIHGRKVGSFGDVTVVSFGHGKILTAYGNSAGMVLTRSAEFAERICTLARYGQRKMQDGEVPDAYADPSGRVCAVNGYNSYLDAVQAAVLRCKLRMLDKWVERRAQIGRSYDASLADLDLITPRLRDGVTSVYRGYIIRVKDRDRVLAELQAHEIEATTLYLPPVHLQPMMSPQGYREGDFPMTEQVARELITLPIYPELAKKQIEQVVAALHACVPPKATHGRHSVTT